MIRTRTSIRNRNILALAATMCFATGPASGGGMNQPMPASLGGGVVSDPVQQEEGKPDDADLSKEAEEWRRQHGVTSTRPLGTNSEPEGGASSAISAGEELGGGEEGDHRTAQQREEEETDEEKAKRLEPAPTHFGHRLSKLD